jgi:hypothetical protein
MHKRDESVCIGKPSDLVGIYLWRLRVLCQNYPSFSYLFPTSNHYQESQPTPSMCNRRFG